MKMLWCWRCRREMPMLEEEEYAQAFRLYGECLKSAKLCRERSGSPLDGADLHERFRPLREWYERATGIACHQNAILHHRLSALGGPCRVCGRPLRSPRAQFCAACGASRDAVSS